MTALLAALVVLGFAGAIGAVHAGGAGPALWMGLTVLVPLSAVLIGRLARIERGRILPLAAPVAFGAVLLALWEVLVTGAGVPMVLLPAPSAIAARMAGIGPMLTGDFVQTFLKAVLSGYLLGGAIGFGTALLVDRSPFLRRGLLPVANLVSALPVIVFQASGQCRQTKEERGRKAPLSLAAVSRRFRSSA